MRPLRSAIALAWVALFCAALFQAMRLTLFKGYSLDEFQYSHAAWLVAQRRMPYRDFFEFHAPLLYLALSPIWRVAGSDPGNIRFLRVGMLPSLALILWGLARLAFRRAPNSRRSLDLAAPLVALCTPAFITLATEIRPDPFAFALFLGSLALLRSPSLGTAPSRSAPFASGALFAAATWASQKALLYGAPVYAVALMLDFGMNRMVARGTRARLVEQPAWWFGGALVVAASVLAYLLATGSVRAWFDQTFVYALAHERDYPGFPVTRYLVPVATASWALFVLAALGITRTVASLFAEGARAAAAHPDVLIVTALAGTLFSYCFARAPFPYALVPFLGMVAVFAARGIGALAEYFRPSTPRARAAAAALALVTLAWFATLHGLAALDAKLATDDKEYQHHVLADLARVTTTSDPVYDNSGGFSSRPHVGFRFYTNALSRTRDAAELSIQIPREIRDAGCTAVMYDLRFDTLPFAARGFVLEHFQPYDDDVWLWGQRYVAETGAGIDATFEAVRDARYFVQPAEAIEGRAMTIDGRAVESTPFSLTRGIHAVRYRGSPRTFFLLWLPADGTRYAPLERVRPHFSVLF